MKDAAHIHMIVDRSGSMNAIRNDVIGAINRFIDDQKAVPGECTFSYVQFDDQAPYEVVQDCVRMADVKHLTAETYIPRGGTPLLDAIGKGIAALGAKLSAQPESERPSKVIFVVQTDGQENASKEYKKSVLANMVKTQTETYKWQFLFLGANMDAIHEGHAMGIPQNTSMTYTANAIGTSNALRAASANVAAYRGGLTERCSFSDNDREAAVTS